MKGSCAIALLALCGAAAVPAAAQAPAPADTAPSDSVFALWLDDVASRTDEEFKLQELSISDAEVDSLLRLWEATGEEPVPGEAQGEPGWRFDAELAAFRYNRVEGVNLVPRGEASAPTERELRAFGQVGYGWASEEVTWRGGLSTELARGAGRPTLEVAHARDVYGYGSGGIAGNSLNALLLSEDWDDYYLGEGASAALAFTPGRVGVEVGFRTEDVASMANATDVSLRKGAFRPNPPIDPGRSRSLALSIAWGDEQASPIAASARGLLVGHGLGGDFDYESWRAEVLGRKPLWFGDLLTARLSGGSVAGSVPYQGLHLLGGFDTLRGYDVNEILARSYVHARVDYKIGTDLLQWVPFVRHLRLQPAPFSDAAAVFERQQRDGTQVALAEPDWLFSAGVEIRQNLMGIPGGGGQLRLDVARRLDRTLDDWTYRFGFTTGR
jgi:hypothetical protein